MEIYMPPKEVMTIKQIRDAYESNDYNAELLLKHLLIRMAELEEGLHEIAIMDPDAETRVGKGTYARTIQVRARQLLGIA